MYGEIGHQRFTMCLSAHRERPETIYIYIYICSNHISATYQTVLKDVFDTHYAYSS